MSKLIYLDYAAATPLDPRVLKAMQPFLTSAYENPSALYSGALAAKNAIENSRKNIAKILNTTEDSIVFTSGGTESDNLAVLGIARAHKKHGKHIIVSAIEHEAVLKPVEYLKRLGYEITILPVDQFGLVTAEAVYAALRPDTILVSIMSANNEVGTIEPIGEIGKKILRWRKEKNTHYPYFHTDACQAAGQLILNVEQLHIDLLTLNAGKIYGPKGSGLLYVRRGVKLEPLFFGGSQERTLRPGTENVAGIIGMSTALNLASKHLSAEVKRQISLQKYFLLKLKKLLPFATLNGPDLGSNRLANNLNLNIAGVDAETLLLYLNERGIACATGSACTTVSDTPSHVLLAIGKTIDQVKSSLRLTLGRQTKKSDLDYVLKSLVQSYQMLANKG